MSDTRDKDGDLLRQAGTAAAGASRSATESTTTGHGHGAVARDDHGAARALAPDGIPEIMARLRRAHGQLGGVIAMIENERSCQDVVTQLSAVAKAVQRAGFAVISQALQQCLADPDASDVDIDAMEKLFLRLA